MKNRYEVKAVARRLYNYWHETEQVEIVVLKAILEDLIEGNEYTGITDPAQFLLKMFQQDTFSYQDINMINQASYELFESAKIQALQLPHGANLPKELMNKGLDN